jgi:hypothetical protein
MMMAPFMNLSSADVPLRKASATSSPESEAIPRHSLRLISRREIFQSIQDDLARRGISEKEKLRPEDLIIQSSVPGNTVDKGLMLKNIRYDPIRREVVFDLWDAQMPQFLPFRVTTRQNPESLGLAPYLTWKPLEAGGALRTESPTISQPQRPVPSKPVVLAKLGQPATLVMLGQNVRITITVVPLQPGVKGQSILVRDTTTQRVMTAEVVDEGLLQTRF